ncbi:AAA family ATPase [Polaribacter sp. MSW13]|uniref:AAA family ATPase n=1 Tax=Polaribacter marinus TaxID=2916838 RepID=A0A9X1VRB5_9FLAO|nr:AAA family ATPase [Polaribacter marinus]MCI2229552.1 AAA family ATPase [Polaribacter marinus]
MDLNTKQQIAKATQKYIDTHSLTYSDVNRLAGVPKEYLVSILKGVFTYNAGKDKVGEIPEKYFSLLATMADYSNKKKYWHIRQTTQMLQTLEILQDARDNSVTRVIIGETGCGKSHTLNLFKKKHPAEVFTIVVGSEDTLNDLLYKVCTALKVPVKGSRSSKIREISRSLEALRLNGRKPILVFDECEYMKPAALCSIKEFYDYLDKKCSITLIGTEQLKQNIERLRNRDAKGIPQLYRRIKFGFRHLRPINRKFTDFLQEIKDKKLKVWLQQNCANYGELHDVLVPCIKESERLEHPLDLPFVLMVLGLHNEDAA